MPARVAPQERAPGAAYEARREGEGLPGPFQAGRRSERSRAMQAHFGATSRGQELAVIGKLAGSAPTLPLRPGPAAARSRPIKEEG